MNDKEKGRSSAPVPVFRLRSDDGDSLHCMDFLSPNILAAGSGNGNLFLWNLQSNRISQKIPIGKSTLLHVIHRENLLFAQEKDGFLHIMKTNESEFIEDRTLSLDFCGFCRFALDPTNDIIFLPKTNSSLCIEDFSGNVLNTLKPDGNESLGEIMCIKCISSDHLLCSYESGHLKLWNLKMNKEMSSLKLNEFLLTVDYDEQSERGVCGNSSNSIQVFEMKNQTLSFKCDIAIKNAGSNMLRIRQDKKIFTSAGWDGQIRVFSWKTLKPLAVMSEHKKAILDINYSGFTIPLWNAPLMGACSLDSSLTLWNIYPPKVP